MIYCQMLNYLQEFSFSISGGGSVINSANRIRQAVYHAFNLPQIFFKQKYMNSSANTNFF